MNLERWTSIFRRAAGDRRGNFAVMTALSMPFAIALSAFAVDLGSLYTERREAQSVTDLAAITAAANMSNVEAAVLATLNDNGFASATVQRSGPVTKPAKDKPVVEISKGRYVADATAVVGKRFEAGVEPANAVKVSLRKTGSLYFGASLMDEPVIGTSAIASTSSQAAFSVGSRLLKVDGGILNALLGALVGGNISLSVMDYNALIAADVNVLSFLDALAVDLNLTGGTYSQVLASQATVGQIAKAMANTAEMGQSGKLALQAIAAGAASTVKIPLNHLVDLGPVGRLGLGQQPAGLSVDASAMSMLTAAAALANGSHQVELALGATIPGLTAATLAVAVGEPEQFSPWLAVGEKGTVVRTAQTRIKLVATVGVGNSNLGGGIKLLSVKLPLHVEVAHAEANLTDITCSTGRPDSRRVTISARPGIASLRLADTDATGFADFSKPQTFRDARIAEVSVKLLLLTLDLLGVDGSASVAVTNNNPTTLVFDNADIVAKKIKSTPTQNITQSAATSLVKDLKLSVSALGLGLDVTALLGTVKPVVITLLNGVTAPVDALLYNLLAALGIKVGEVDVRVTGASCGRSVLVQ